MFKKFTRWGAALMIAVVATGAWAADAPKKQDDGLSPMQREVLERVDSIFGAIGNTVNKGTDMVGKGIDKAGELAAKGGEVLSEQLPDIAYQYVAFGRAVNTAAILLGIVLAWIGYHLFWNIACRNSRNLPNSSGEWHSGRVVSFIFGLVGIIAGFLTVVFNAKEFLLVWFAPKMWLILEIVELVKRVKGA